MALLSGSRVVLGVTGGIAAYKAVDLTSKLVQAGVVVDVIMTTAATRLIGEMSFQALTKRPVHTSVFEEWTSDSFGHISLGHNAAAILVAPATANSIAKLAHGLADDMLGAVALSSSAPLIIVPAMEHDMYRHPATQANLATLIARGATVVGPEKGRLASGEMGEGRMSAPETIAGALRLVFGRSGPLAGQRMVVTAGGTREPLDPIRYLGNRSSGRMGHALAQAAIDAGADVTLITTASGQATPYGARVIQVETAKEMHAAVEKAVDTASILAMSAAVADFRPAEAKRSKIKKTEGSEGLPLELVRNPDIVATVRRPGLIKIGFAAETEGLLAYASAKLAAKGLEMIVANDAETTIGQTDSTAHLIFAHGDSIELPRMPKDQVAARIVIEIARIVRERPSQ